MKRTTGMIFSLLPLLCFSADAVLNAQTFRSDGFVLELVDGFRSAIIVGYEGTERNINIPSHVTGGAVVVAIGDGAFNGRSLTGVTIPNSVRTIGDRAFSDNHLTGISIPFGVMRIGYQAFMRNRLTSVEIPDSVILIGNQAFSGNRLTSVTVPYTMVTIGKQAFMNNQLTSVTILSSLATVGDQAFRGNSINSITIGRNVNIGSTAFGNNFHGFYNNNRKMGGIYTFDGRNWSFSEK